MAGVRADRAAKASFRTGPAMLGFGRGTQVDLPFENEGILGDRQLFEEWRETQPWRVRKPRAG